MTSVHTVLEVLLSCEQRCALATIIHVEGSTYCKEGTIMLFCEDGTKNWNVKCRLFRRRGFFLCSRSNRRIKLGVVLSV